MKVLIAVPWIPYPPTDGGRIRSYALIREAARRHQVSLFCVKNPGEDRGGCEVLQSCCQRTEWVSSSIDYSLVSKCRSLWDPLPFGSAQPEGEVGRRLLACCDTARPDVVHVQGMELAGCLQRLVGRVPVFFDMVDCNSLHMLRRTRQTRHPVRRFWYRLQYGKFRQAEEQVLANPLTVTLASRVDVETLLRYRHHPGVKIRVLSNGAEIAPRIIHQEPDRPPRLVFTGNMAYPPNEDAVYYFCRQILPLIHRKCPDVWLDVIGNHPSVRLRRFCGRSKQVAVLGFVPDLRAEVIRRTLYVSPLRIGTGIKLKILEAMACGMPIVASPMSIEGMPVTDGRHLLVARSAKEFADKVLEVLTKPALRQQLGMHAQQLIKDRYEWETIGQELDRIYQEAVR